MYAVPELRERGEQQARYLALAADQATGDAEHGRREAGSGRLFDGGALDEGVDHCGAGVDYHLRRHARRHLATEPGGEGRRERASRRSARTSDEAVDEPAGTL